MEEFSSIGYIKAWLQATDGCNSVEQKVHTHESLEREGWKKGMSRFAAHWKWNRTFLPTWNMREMEPVALGLAALLGGWRLHDTDGGERNTKDSQKELKWPQFPWPAQWDFSLKGKRQWTCSCQPPRKVPYRPSASEARETHTDPPKPRPREGRKEPAKKAENRGFMAL